MVRSHKHTLTMRFTPAQYRSLAQLSKKLNLDKTSVLRFALARLAEAEGVLEKMAAEPEGGKRGRGERP